MGLPEATPTARWKRMSWLRNDLRVVEAGEHPGDLIGHRRDVIAAGTFGRQAGGADLEDAAHLVHLVAREAVERRQEAQRLAAQARWAIGDEGARTAARSNHAQRGQRAQPGAHRRPAHAEVRGQLALGG